jgi:putative pyruvate formate lyase activating enzyme
MGDLIQVARASLHMWEEPCISGTNGSGTVFFTGCNLKCVFCQNHSIAIGQKGKEVSPARLADLFLMLQDKGAHNINLVTPSHYIPGIAQALTLAKAKNMTLPVVYNTSGYDSVQSLTMLDGLVDIYLPDFKYVSGTLSQRYSHAPDYFEVASKSLAEMYRQVSDPVFEDDLIKKGIIVRHLVLPGCTADSKEVIRYLYETYGDRIFISIMNQYTPLPHVASYPELNRKITEAEYDEVVDFAIDLGVEQGFIQEGDTASESFIPEFDFTGLL